MHASHLNTWLVHQGEIRLLPVIWQIFIWWECLADWVILGIVICWFMLLGGKHETSAFWTPELTPPLHLHTLSLFCACCHTHPLHITGWQKSSAFWMGCTFCLNAVLMCHAFVVMLCITCVSWCSHVWHHFWNSSCLNSIFDRYSQVFRSCIEKWRKRKWAVVFGMRKEILWAEDISSENSKSNC